MGGIPRPPQTEVIEATIADGFAGGARVPAGGGRRHDLAGSLRVGDPAESLAVANDCAHGLNASVFSRDRRPARDLATRLVADGVNINGALLGAAIPSLSFGEKWSGFGRAHGPEGLPAFSRVKSISSDDPIFAVPSLAAAMLHDPRSSTVPADPIPVRQGCCSADSSGIPAASRRPAAVTSFNNIR